MYIDELISKCLTLFISTVYVEIMSYTFEASGILRFSFTNQLSILILIAYGIYGAINMLVDFIALKVVVKSIKNGESSKSVKTWIDTLNISKKLRAKLNEKINNLSTQQTEKRSKNNE